MARALLIANPVAARTDGIAIEAVATALGYGGWNVEVALTAGPGDARRLAEAGVANDMEMVVVFGGDGTTMQAAAALVGTEIPLGIIPGGTGNLLAGNLRIPPIPLDAVEALLRSSPRPFDLGRVERADGVHYFAVACGAGYDARVMAGTPTELKRAWGMGAYVATTFRLLGELQSHLYRITVDGVVHETRAALALVANCGEVIPPRIRLGAQVRPDDGILDLVVMRADGLGDSVRAVWQLLRERSDLADEKSYVDWLRGREIRIETDPIQPVQLDGEPGGETPFTAAIVPSALRILLPASV
ncbi:MAG TPA: diacylglycerol kinase family protein [Gemmatimonadales bacterium]|nr:diacylglycerol kinase family protein [Gemmatimonadales bacterium]